MNKVRMISGLGRGFFGLIAGEVREGTLLQTLGLTVQHKRPTFANDLSHAELLERKALRNKDRPFLHFHDQTFSYRQMNENANRTAHYFSALGAGPGQGMALMMKNGPRWLDAFFGTQRLGMCAVPVNIALRGDQLAHIFNHSEARFACVDHDLLPFFEKVKDRLESPPRVIVNPQGSPSGFKLSPDQVSLEDAYGPGNRTDRPSVLPRQGDPCLLLYTSGTTGLPKGVPTRYGRTNIKIMGLLAKAMLNPEDIYFTCLPLFHANALLLTLINALSADAQMALAERFSARRFWDDVRESKATVFNTIGAMISILMKQPERPSDRDHRVRYVLSAACPADMWAPFEKRFGVKIVEGYGAVDGGGFIVINFGNAPVGSLGKPIGGKYRIIDADRNDVPAGQPGELIFRVGGQKQAAVEYYKDEQSTSKKVRDGWLHTGDLVYSDDKGYLYFVGRKTESLRRRGENISAYEVEQAILRHPDVLECAVYAVPSELGEDDVMAAIVPLEGKAPEAADLATFLEEHLARFAIPRYYRFLDELPKTETQRVIKTVLEKEGVTKDTVDLESKAKDGRNIKGPA